MRNLVKNNSVAKVFFWINILAVFFYLFQLQITVGIGSMWAHMTRSHEQDFFHVGLILIVILVYAGLLRNFKTLSINNLQIQFPYKLHCFLLVLELCYTLYLARVGDGQAVRAAFTDSTYWLPKYLKVSTLFLYMTTLLLFAKVSLDGWREPDRASSKKINIYRLLALVTFLVFLYKDYRFATRGGFINCCVFAMAGWTYVRPLSLEIIVRHRLPILFSGATLLIIFLFSTWTRANDISSVLIWDSLLFRFNSNIMVAASYLDHTLFYRIGSGGQYLSEWISLRADEFLNEGHLALYFFPTLDLIVNKILAFNPAYISKSTYFNIYGDYPYNSYSFLLPLLVGGPVVCIFFAGYIILLKRLATTNISVNFYTYSFFMYFAALSFTGCALVEMPFIAIPIISFIFSGFIQRYLRYEENVNESL